MKKKLKVQVDFIKNKEKYQLIVKYKHVGHSFFGYYFRNIKIHLQYDRKEKTYSLNKRKFSSTGVLYLLHLPIYKSKKFKDMKRIDHHSEQNE